jgi:hypothetical protein
VESSGRALGNRPSDTCASIGRRTMGYEAHRESCQRFGCRGGFDVEPDGDLIGTARRCDTCGAEHVRTTQWVLDLHTDAIIDDGDGDGDGATRHGHLRGT